MAALTAADCRPRFAAVRVLVVGDAMLDRYWFGEVERVSPEAPVPVVAFQRSEERPGGAANVAMNVAALGARATLLSLRGADVDGGCLGELVRRAGIDDCSPALATLTTTVKLRVIARNQQLLRMDTERAPGAAACDALVEPFETALAGSDILVLSDYGKGALAQVSSLIARARAAGVPVLVDPKGRDFSRYAGASLITPNRSEFRDALGAWHDDDELAARAQQALQRYALGGLLVTLSEAGMVLFRSDRGPCRQAARSQEVFDVSGAGDTVIAAMAVALAAGLDDRAAVALANAAAGVVVGRLGVATATLEEALDGCDAGPHA